MEWEAVAAGRLEKVPFFIRKKVKKQIEEYVQAKGGGIVTNQDVTDARQSLTGIKTGPGSEDHAILKTAGGSLSAKELDHIEKMVEKGVVLEGLDAGYWQVKVCGGAAGCPLSLIDDKRMAEGLAGVLNESDLGSYLAGSIEGPVLFHHKFRVALSGCPNACSQPQIVDFGVIGQSHPGRSDEACTGCGLCVKTCQEDAIQLNEGGPKLDYDRCMRCGQCIQVCPAEVIREKNAGYRVMVGGKLGRHPVLAKTILELADEKQVYAALKGAVRVFMEHRRGKERMAGLVERLGWEKVKGMILGG